MWHSISKEEALKSLKTNVENGLNEKEVKRRLEEFGDNRLKEKKKENIMIRFIKQFNDFMIIILIIAAIISAVISVVEKNNDYIDSIIIFAIVVLNAILRISTGKQSREGIRST